MIRTFLAAAVAAIAGTLTCQAQVIFTDPMEDGSNWTVNATADTTNTFGWDYSTLGIPSAPNSGDSSTLGLRMAANISSATLSELNAVVTGLSMTNDHYVVRFDYWINANGPFPGGGSGSTEFIGGGVGMNGGDAGRDGASLIVTGEGGSSRDYRMYKNKGEQFPESGQYAAGNLNGDNNSSHIYYSLFGDLPAPLLQQSNYVQQTGNISAGSQGFTWHECRIIVDTTNQTARFDIDGVWIGTVDGTIGATVETTGGVGVVYADLFTSVSDNADLSFGVFDNFSVEVTNLVVVDNIVTVTAPSPLAMEEGQQPATFTFTRQVTGAPLTVNYSIAGLAENGVDYTNQLGGALTGSIMFGASDSTVDLVVVPIDDDISELEEDIKLTVIPGGGYIAGGNATATIMDNDPVILVIGEGAPSMYERFSNDYSTFSITRLGDPNVVVSLDTTNLSFSGGATLGVDFALNGSLLPYYVDQPETNLVELLNPLDNGVYSGNKTFEVEVLPGANFSVSNATVSLTIIDDENPPAAVLYTNALTSAADASNWKLAYANGDTSLPQDDYLATFGFDLTSDPSVGGGIASPPGGATTALRTTVNKVYTNNAGLNLYMTNMSFGGNYAVRFNMNLIYDTLSSYPNNVVSTHGPLFGINHDGNQTNWIGTSVSTNAGPWAADGVWCWISADGNWAQGDYRLFTGAGGALPNTGWTNVADAYNSAFLEVFKGVGDTGGVFPPKPGPYSQPGFGSGGEAGLVSNDAPVYGGDTSTWTDVEIKQLGNVITLSLNKSQVLQYVNTTTFTNGFIMLGYDDPFNSLGEIAGAVYYANLSVVELLPPEITHVTRAGADVTIDFTSNDGSATSASFTLESASAVNGPYAPATGAVITQLPDGTYQGTASTNAVEQYYRISQ